MAKTDKKTKKAGSKGEEPIKIKPVVPASSKEILAKAAALTKSISKKARANGRKASSASSDDSSSAEDSSGAESDSNEEASLPAKSTPVSGAPSLTQIPLPSNGSLVKKTAAMSSDDSSNASSSEESSSEDSGPAHTKTSPDKGKKTSHSSDSEDDSSDVSSSEDSSGESDSDEEQEDKISAPVPVEAHKKRKADDESAAVPKKVKFANGNVVTSGVDAVEKRVSVEKRAQAFGDVSNPPSAVLFVGNLSFGVNEDTLWETFGEHGDIKSVRIPTDYESGRPRGFAYVEFSEVEAAKEAFGALQGAELDGRTLRLDFSQPRDSTGGGRGGAQGGRGGRGRGGFGGDRGRGRGGFGGDRGRGGFGGDRGRGGFGGDRGRGAGRGGRGGDRGGRGRGRGARTSGIAQFEGQKITFD